MLIEEIICIFERTTNNKIQDPKDDFKDLYINSILFIKFLIEIEDMYDIEFDEDDLDFIKFSNLLEIYEYVNSKRN